MRTAGVAVLADAAEIIKSCPFLGGGKGRRHSGELDKQELMILYGVFTMRVRSFRWLTSADEEYVEAWDLFLTKSVVFMHLLRKKKTLPFHKRGIAGQFLVLKLAT